MPNRVRTLAGDFGLVAAIILLWLAYVEIACFWRLRWSQEFNGVSPARIRSAYQHEAWANALIDEWKPSYQINYHPYVLWRRKPFQGQTINIDQEGLRRTVPSQCDGTAYTIWMFGGSSLWGTGSPDWLTIPSLLARQYQQAGRKVCVLNYGEAGWVSTQDLIELEMELDRSARKPDLVIFYGGGIADVWPRYLYGKPGLHQNFDEVRDLLQSHRTGGGANFRFLLSTNTAQVFMQYGLRSRPQPPPPAMDTNLEAGEIARWYLGNVNSVNALARQYGFEDAFFLAPLLITGKKPLSPEEATIEKVPPEQVRLVQKVGDLVRDAAPPRLFDLRNIFDRSAETIYFSIGHVDAEGNLMIAKRIYDSLPAGHL